MADHYIYVPAHIAKGAVAFADAAEAGVSASLLVQKDRVPRVVVRLHSEVRVSDTPEVDIVMIAEVGRGA